MLKKTVTYTDFNDEEVTEDLYFHLSAAELIELEMSMGDGGLKSAMENMIAAEDGATIIREFKRILMMAYGRKSGDGRRFEKSDELRQRFESSQAYSALFMELITDTGAMVEFVNGMVPKDLEKQAARFNLDGSPKLEVVKDQVVNTTIREITMSRYSEMSHEDRIRFNKQIAEGKARIVPDEMTDETPDGVA